VQKIGAVILAAGASSRFGKPKQLIQYGGKSMVRRAIDVATKAGCLPIAVVVGSDSDDITRELQKANVAIVLNQRWKNGIGSSIRAGVQHVIDAVKDVDAITLLVCDQPFVDGRMLKQLIALRAKTRKPIVASSYAKTLGVPALFDRACFQELLALDDATGAKRVILANRRRVAEFSFPKGAIDIDTLEDWAAIQRTR
jgi:molybdenum cofactor cytidylyltransferase